MNQKIDSVSVKVVEEDPNGITIHVRNKPDHNGCNSENVANAPLASTLPQISKSPLSEPQRQPTRKLRRKRDSIQYRDTGKWRDLVVQEWEAVAPGETLAGMTLGEFKAATERVVAERETLKRLRDDVTGAIARRNAADQEAKKAINRFIYGVKASPRFGPDSDLYRQLGYVTDLERQSATKRVDTGNGESTDQ